MARLWSLLTVDERNAYEERARLSGTVDGGCIDLGPNTNNGDKPMLSNPRTHAVEPVSFGDERARNAGLFATKTPVSSDTILRLEESTGVGKSKRVSVSLPRRSKLIGNGPDASVGALASTDWDELLPTVLDDDLEEAANPNEASKKPISPHVRPPPPRRNSPKC